MVIPTCRRRSGQVNLLWPAATNCDDDRNFGSLGLAAPKGGKGERLFEWMEVTLFEANSESLLCADKFLVV
jgi:hypothetical protein